ncbi:secretory phospholipase A2 receptor-like [Pangasianodon hypophthalmus]|uniref:secretory phospholipase A2 receptor-like n=1 Tax=Pangasianodon hypophthalmus TaxID=310915 RepID=UPI00230818D8|nr:secretory phospholipase A2 receptor-like [Pangasianodon hypophthalmus]
MKTAYSVLLLAGLIGSVKCLFIRRHVHINQLLSWTDAQKYCRTNYVDLLTINSQNEYDRFKNDATAYLSINRWIGLRNEENERSFTNWSDGSILGFTKWDSNEPDKLDTEHCVHTANGNWYNSLCSSTRYFVCYIWLHQVIIVQEMKSWREALEHCRTFYTDLISLTPETALVLAKNKSMNIQTPSFWTGLNFLNGFWFWVNKEPLENWTTLPSCPTRPFLCGARKTGADVWENPNCEKKLNFICYKKTG